MKKHLLTLLVFTVVVPAAHVHAGGPWYTRPGDWGKQGIILVPPRNPPSHNPIVEVPSRPSEPGIQFDQRVQSRPNVKVVNGVRTFRRDGQTHRLAPKPTSPIFTPRNHQRLGRHAPR